MRTRVSTVLVFLLVMPTLMGCFGEDAKPPAKVEHPFGFEEAIPSGVWYHIGVSPSNQNVTNILNESARLVGSDGLRGRIVALDGARHNNHQN